MVKTFGYKSLGEVIDDEYVLKYAYEHMTIDEDEDRKLHDKFEDIIKWHYPFKNIRHMYADENFSIEADIDYATKTITLVDWKHKKSKNVMKFKQD